MNLIETFCKNIFDCQNQFIITLNDNRCIVHQYELNKFMIENLVTGEMIDAEKCKVTKCGFAIVDFVYNDEGYELCVGILKTLNEIAVINREQN